MTKEKSCDRIKPTRKEGKGFRGLLTGVLLLSAAAADLHKNRVSNRIIFLGWLLGIITNIRYNGYMGMLEFTFGAVVPICVLWILFYFRMLGAGDIKLFSIVGGLYGVPFVLKVMVTAFFLGAVMSVFQLLRHRSLKYRLHYLAEYVSNYLKTGVRKPYYQKERDEAKAAVHFAAAILGGFLLCIVRKGGGY